MSDAAFTPEIVPLIMGPLLLVLTGALFLWDYAGGYAVGQTWPLLLILLGLGKVAERVLSPPADRNDQTGEAQ